MIEHELNRWRWLQSTLDLQEGTYGFDFEAMAADPQAHVDYIVEMHTAAVCELTEFMDEVQWKSWSSRRGEINRKHAVKELVDVAHFVANLLVSLGVTDDEWEELYQAKQAVNRKRQDEGYDAVTGKCPGCRRAYDDGIKCVPNPIGWSGCVVT